jgi:hypothetical protein
MIEELLEPIYEMKDIHGRLRLECSLRPGCKLRAEGYTERVPRSTG